MICPSREEADLAKVMKAKLAALSMTSMERNCVMRSFLMKKPMIPRTNMIILTARK
jgi:hypothetical protein